MVAVTWALLADPPGIPGLGLRPWRDAGDFEPMAEVLNDACASDGIDRVETAKSIADHYSRLDNCDPAADTILAEVDGRLLGYGRVMWWQEHAGVRRYLAFGMIRGEARNRGLGTAMLTHNEARLRQIAAGHPPEVDKTFEVFCAETETGARALYEAFGYTPVHHEADLIRRDLQGIPEAPLPEDVVVRTPRPDEMRMVWEAEQEAFRDHIGSAPGTENDYREFLEFEWNDPTLWRVAWDGVEVAGMVRSFINERENDEFGRRRGWTENISVRRPYRRRGLARALLVRSLQAVKDRGMTEAALGVLTENPHGAFRLYESVGFEVVRTWTTLHKPLT